MADSKDGDDPLLPLPTLAVAEQKLAPFLKRHPLSKLTIGELKKYPDWIKVKSPWGDSTLSLLLSSDVEDMVQTLNNVYLHERLSAIWHEDTKDLEVVWTAFKLSSGQEEVADRKFLFHYNKKKYTCEFSKSSDRLLAIAERSFPESNPTPTNFRNLQSFSRYMTEDEVKKAQGSIVFPRSFWIRKLNLAEKNLIPFLESLNFYMSYYDSMSPRILIHDVHDTVNPKLRYISGSFPPQITGRLLDENLMSFWDATRQPNPILKFIFFYRIIEYAASHYLDSKVRTNLIKCLSNPVLSHDMQKAVEEIIGAFDGIKADDVPRFNNLIASSVKPSVVWDEIHNNRSIFIETAKFDGGYVLPPIISKDETAGTFAGGGIIKFSDAIRKIRNVLAHGRDQATATAITPTPRNMRIISAWVNVIAAAAGEVVLYGNNT